MITSSAPLLVEPTSFQAYLNNINSAQRADDPVNDWHSNQVQCYRNISILPMMGVFNLPAGLWWERDVSIVQEQLRNIQMDDACDTVILHFRTPGGYAIGQDELISAIREVRDSGKVVIAFCDQDCFSYGYYIAAECDLLIGTPTSRWGSVSGYLFLEDYSKVYEERGIEVVGHSTGSVKAIGYPGLKVTEEQKEELKNRVVPSSDDFKNHVAERRGLSQDLMQGQIWRAKDAPAGVVDQIVPSLDHLLAAMISM